MLVVTTSILSFILPHMNISYLHKSNKKIDVLKVITLSVTISFIFTFIITIISIRVDKEILENTKKSS